MEYKLMKNKKGIVGMTIILIIVGVLAVLGFGGGLLTAYKINEIIKSIPTPVWIGFIILILLLMFPKKK